MIDLNKAEDYGANDVRIFNSGDTGIVKQVAMRIELKGSADAENAPDYKLYAKDDIGEVNEGYYYQDDENASGWKNYQAQRLIRLAKGVFGEDYVFPSFDSPREALDGIMKLVAPALKNTPFDVVVTYGTTKKPSQYLGFKPFGRFIENPEVYPVSKLSVDARYDQLTRPQPKPEEEIKQEIEADMTATDDGDEAPAWLSDDN